MVVKVRVLAGQPAFGFVNLNFYFEVRLGEKLKRKEPERHLPTPPWVPLDVAPHSDTSGCGVVLFLQNLFLMLLISRWGHFMIRQPT